MARKIRDRLEKIPAWLPTAAVAAAILWLTLAPHPVGDVDVPLFPGADKAVHALMFGALALAADIDWMRVRHWKPLGLPRVSATAAISSMLGIAIEFLQKAMGAGRSFETADMIADIFGATAVSALWIIIGPILEDRRHGGPPPKGDDTSSDKDSTH